MTPNELSVNRTIDLAALREEYNRVKLEATPQEADSEKLKSYIQVYQDLSDRLVFVGAGLADPADRQSAQGMLNYCSAKLLALTPHTQKKELSIIAPYDGGAGNIGETDGPALGLNAPSQNSLAPPVISESEPFDSTLGTTESTSTATNAGLEIGNKDLAREQVRIKAFAQQWRMSGKSAGYLLSGPALAQAAPFWGKDPEITGFIAASRHKVKSDRGFVTLLVIMGMLLLGIVGTGWLWAPAMSRQIKVLMTRSLAASIAGPQTCMPMVNEHP